MGPSYPFRKIQRRFGTARDRCSQEDFRRIRAEDTRHFAAFKIETILVEPPLSRIDVHDVQ